MMSKHNTGYEFQTSSPWILRYLSAAVILSRYTPNNPTATSGRSKYALKEIVRIIQMEEYQYSDPITRFLKELYVEFDFEEARRWLEEAEGVVARDFFLAEFAGMFLDCARWLVSEAYCRIHQKIDIESVFTFRTLITDDADGFNSDLSQRLNLGQEGEKWIVNLIRDMRMGADAKVDLEKVRSPSITYIPFLLTYPPERISYQPTAITALSTVIEKTRGLAFCTQALGAVMNRRLRETEGPWKAMKMEKEGRGRGGDCGCG